MTARIGARLWLVLGGRGVFSGPAELALFDIFGRRVAGGAEAPSVLAREAREAFLSSSPILSAFRLTPREADATIVTVVAMRPDPTLGAPRYPS